jgi:NADPH2:quinone reductase
VVGFTGGPIPEVKVNRLLLNNIEVVGAGWGAYAFSKPEFVRTVAAEVESMVRDGYVRPVVGARFPLEQAADAMRLIEQRRALGKVVLEL